MMRDSKSAASLRPFKTDLRFRLIQLLDMDGIQRLPGRSMSFDFQIPRHSLSVDISWRWRCFLGKDCLVAMRGVTASL